MGFNLFLLVQHRSLTSRDDVIPLLTLVAHGILPLAVGQLVLDTITSINITVPVPLPGLPCVLPCALPGVSSCLFEGCRFSTLCTALPGTNSFTSCSPISMAQAISQANSRVSSAVFSKPFWILSWFSHTQNRLCKVLFRYTPKLQ